MFFFQRTKFAHRHSINIGESSSRPRRLQQVIEMKASKIIKKASQTASIGLGMSRKPLPTSLYVSEDSAPDEQEMENYLVLTAGLQKLMQAERSLVARILPANMQPQVLEMTVRPAMDLVVHDGESIATRAKTVHR